MEREIISTHQKALQINLDPAKYGTFAEIGAGQEVARWFFRVGGAAGTIAKTISAYDMTISDAIYGQAERYVSRQRLETMLQHEYDLLVERLAQKRGATTRFFVFADTVVARSYSRHDDAHGWLGIRFQKEPGEDAFADRRPRPLVGQRKPGGTGGAGHFWGQPGPRRDVPARRSQGDDRFAGGQCGRGAGGGGHDPGFRAGLRAIGQPPHGPATGAERPDQRRSCSPPTARSSSRRTPFTKSASWSSAAVSSPVTNVTLDMLRCAQALFVQEPKVQGEEVLTLMEMTLKNLTDGDKIDPRDFLDRVDILGALGKTVLISDFGGVSPPGRLLLPLHQKNDRRGDGRADLEGNFRRKVLRRPGGRPVGILRAAVPQRFEALCLSVAGGQNGGAHHGGQFARAPNLRHLHAYLMENRFIEGLRDYDEKSLPIFSREVLAKIRAGDATWEAAVPPPVAKIIRERKLFGYKEAA